MSYAFKAISGELAEYGFVFRPTTSEGPGARGFFVVHCDACERDIESHDQLTYPAKQVIAKLRSKGHSLARGKAFKCGMCRQRDARAARAEKLARFAAEGTPEPILIPAEKATPAVLAAPNAYETMTHWLADEAAAKAAESVDLPAKPAPVVNIGPSPKVARLVYSLLDCHFDEATGRYDSGYDDARIAKEIGLATDMVTRIRDEAYGPLQEDALVAEFRDDIALVKMEVVDCQERFAKEMAALSARVEALEAKAPTIVRKVA